MNGSVKVRYVVVIRANDDLDSFVVNHTQISLEERKRRKEKGSESVSER